MKSRVYPKYKTKYRVGNWRAYERALVQRGDVTALLSADARDTWRPAPSGRPGGQKRFSDLAIETALTLRLVFRLPLRQAEGFVRSILSLMDVHLEAPDHTTLSRRSQHLAIELSRLPAKGPIDLIVDSTGLSIVGEGEWAAAKYGRRGTRGWRKLYVDVDRSGVIVVHTLTDPTVDDATTGVDLIDAVDDDIARVTADAAYDTLAFYATAGARRRQWKKASGYHRQARVENAFFRYKSIVGEVLRARTPAGQRVEALLACDVLNRMTELGRPESYGIGP